MRQLEADANKEVGTEQTSCDTGRSVRDLRRRWKPHKQRLREIASDHPTNLRIHRACSWLQRAEEINDDKDLDLALMGQWVAFNALYSKWDSTERQPCGDRQSWREFLNRILQLDDTGHMSQVLQEHKRLVVAILRDEYLSSYFWEEPSSKRASQSKKAMHESSTWYIEGNWTLILDRLIERIYLLRCQLTHGAATFGGMLNRTASRHCSTMLQHPLPAIILVIADHGADEDWGETCYPPHAKQG